MKKTYGSGPLGPSWTWVQEPSIEPGASDSGSALVSARCTTYAQVRIQCDGPIRAENLDICAP